MSATISGIAHSFTTCTLSRCSTVLHPYLVAPHHAPSHHIAPHCTSGKPMTPSIDVADPLRLTLRPPTIQRHTRHFCTPHLLRALSHPIATLPHPPAPSRTLLHPVTSQVSLVTPSDDVADPSPHLRPPTIQRHHRTFLHTRRTLP